MENESWNKCLAMIREKVTDRMYDTWFAPVVFEGYDAEKNTVLLAVPNKYIYECLEQFFVRLMGQVLSANFANGARLQYRLLATPAAAAPAATPVSVPAGQRIQINIPDARQQMERWLRHFLGDQYRWLPSYDQVTEWLTDNKGRGLLCVGTPRTGKTVLCTKVLPAILCSLDVTVVTSQEMCSKIDDLIKKRCVVVDDIGKERVGSQAYGTHARPFYHLCDAAERQDNLLIVATSFSTTPVPKTNPQASLYPRSIQQFYGQDVLDRLKAITKVIVFKGDSLRQK